MKNRLKRFLLMVLIITSIITNGSILFLINYQVNKNIEKTKESTIKDIEKIVLEFDRKIMQMEKEINLHGYSVIKYVSGELIEEGILKENVNSSYLEGLCSEYEIDDIYLVRDDGKIYKSTDPRMLYMNIFQMPDYLTNNIKEIYGKGEVCTQRVIPEINTGKLNKYYFYNPKDTDLIIGIAIDFNSYIEEHNYKSYNKELLADILLDPSLNKTHVNEIDVYDLSNDIGWSVMRSKKTLSKDINFIEKLRLEDTIVENNKGQVAIYDYQENDEGRPYCIEVKMDFTIIYDVLYKVMIIILIMSIILVLVLYPIIFRYFIINFNDRIEIINRQLNKLSNGDYSIDGEYDKSPSRLHIKDSDELQNIIYNIDELRDNIETRENELKSQLSYIKCLIDTVPVPMFTKNSLGIYSDCNIAYMKAFSISEDYLKDKKCLEFFSEELKRTIKETDKYLLKNGGEKFTNEKIVYADGSVHDIVLCKSTYVNADGSIAGIVGVFYDITSRLEAEKNKMLLEETIELDRIKTEFFANISHEFKTPINIILSSIQLIELYLNKKDDNLDISKIIKYTNVMKQNDYRLIRLVNNFIDVIKLDSGYIEADLKNLNIVEIVENITLSVVSFIENNGIEIEFDTNLEEKIVSFDPYHMERILLNLISNAIKFTKPGGKITVVIQVEEEETYIFVRDTGIGIAEDKQEIIFKKYIQIDKSLTREHEGSGIGLSIVKNLVELNGGEISVNSKLGKGSEFIIKIPNKVIETSSQEKTNNYNSLVERISIEFSDIISS
ncbi:PAS domain-containing sensor histidine kinase [Clostridium sp. DL1XJH146]